MVPHLPTKTQLTYPNSKHKMKYTQKSAYNYHCSHMHKSNNINCSKCYLISKPKHNSLANSKNPNRKHKMKYTQKGAYNYHCPHTHKSNNRICPKWCLIQTKTQLTSK